MGRALASGNGRSAVIVQRDFCFFLSRRGFPPLLTVDVGNVGLLQLAFRNCALEEIADDEPGSIAVGFVKICTTWR